MHCFFSLIFFPIPLLNRKHYDAPDANIFDDKLADDSWDVSFDSNSDTDSLWAFDTFNKVDDLTKLLFDIFSHYTYAQLYLSTM